MSIRKTTRWGVDEPMRLKTFNELLNKLYQRYGTDKVRIAILVMPVAVEKVIDNEADARETLKRLKWLEIGRQNS